MLLLQLPDDILFNILYFVKPPDLIRLRKICKRLQAFTLEPIVWRAAYRTSGYFLPVTSPTSQTIHDFERVLLRAYRWNKIWVQQAEPVTHTLSCIWSFQSGIEHLQHMEIAHSRFIFAIGGRKALQVYDLETKREIFNHQTIDGAQVQWLEYHRSETTESEAELGFFTPFVSHNHLAIFKIDPQGEVDLINTSIQNSGDVDIIAIGHGFCIIPGPDGSDVVSLLHIPSQKVYSLCSTLIDDGYTCAIILPRHVLMYDDQYLGETPIALFTLPDHATAPVDLPIRQTHSGILRKIFRERPTYISSDISEQGDTESIWLVALFEDGSSKGIRPLRITLEAGAKMTFYLPNAPKCDPSIAYPTFTEYQVLPGLRARGSDV
ncbi:hypothetical protein GYMLUDRAFT_35432 [Collybiopsis luxurians FD-317 M1]|nr:hypothetical protein GYMLUDRAFT_35432 [Collybiopsis luxurians FD-317 M1]